MRNQHGISPIGNFMDFKCQCKKIAQLLYILLPSMCRQTESDIPLIAAAKKLYYIWWNEMKIPPSPLNVLHFRKEERNNELSPFEDIDWFPECSRRRPSVIYLRNNHSCSKYIREREREDHKKYTIQLHWFALLISHLMASERGSDEGAAMAGLKYPTRQITR